MTTPSAAANAYASLARLADPSAGVAKALGDGANNGPSFGALLHDVLGAAAHAGQKADAQTQLVASGKADIVDVVTAVSESEVAVQALVSVRDRVISAYEEIMRMPI
jgi:flagellar hook-basal body complex protein FliE